MNHLNTSRIPARDRESFWNQQICQWKASGLNLSAYCRQEGLKLHQLLYWRKKLESSPHGSRLRLVPISNEDPGGLATMLDQPAESPSRRRPSQITVDLGGARLEVEDTIDPQTLRRLALALNGLPQADPTSRGLQHGGSDVAN